MAAKGVSLVVGVDKVDKAAYGDFNGYCSGKRDQAAVSAFLKARGFTLIEPPDIVSTDWLIGAIRAQGKALNAGDLFVLYFSGHGGTTKDRNSPKLTVDLWALYDRLLINHEVYRELLAFKRGVRILVVADCCSSSDPGHLEALFIPDRFLARDFHSAPVDQSYPGPFGRKLTVRSVPSGVIEKLLESKPQIYGPIWAELKSVSAGHSPAAAMISLGAAQQDEFAYDDGQQGVFTANLLDYVRSGLCQRGYPRLIQDLAAFTMADSPMVNGMPQPPQVPQCITKRAGDDLAFINSFPFTFA